MLINMQCPLCKMKMEAKAMLTGGCGGHYGEDDRCYCDSADVHIEFQCPNNVLQSWVADEKSKRGGRVEKNKNYCKQPNLKVGELSDQDSLSRWFTKHYIPTEGTNIF